jgi:twitching motility protein PilU
VSTISPFLKVALKLAADRGASDVYLTPNAPIMVKLEGETVPITGQKEMLTTDVIEQLGESVMSDRQKEFYRTNLEIDFALYLPEVGRFRVNMFHQRSHASMVLRYIRDVPTLDSLGLPPVLQPLIMQKRGLLFMVGATGSGKSTTLAAMIDYRNSNVTGHILTIEDPVEFYHRNKKSLVNQRQVGHDTHSYANALRSAVRESPDVIMIGEARDRETIDACIQLAGTGHLVLSTLHANNAYQTMQRIISMFPTEAREQLLMDLSLSLRAVISQRLVRGKNGRRVPAVEVMICTPYISELIRKGDISTLREAMEQSSDQGMQTFDDSLTQLYKDGKIDLEQALVNADSRSNLESKLSFG